MKTYSRIQFISLLAGENQTKRALRDLQVLITRAKQKGLIYVPSQQKIACNNPSLSRIQRIADLLIWINQNETPQLRTSEQTKKLIDSLIDCSQNNTIFVIFAFLCPSYLKGKDAVGFSDTIGETTKRGIKNTHFTYAKLKSLGFRVECRIIFSDLILENYQELVKNNLHDDIKLNIKSVKNFIQQTNRDIAFKKLSNYLMTRDIPRQGIEGEPNRVDADTYSLVLKRNQVFYKEQFGWGENKIISRTRILACSYPVIGDLFRSIFPNSLFVYTANSLERAAMYQGEFISTDPIPMFFPKKGELVKN